MRRGPPRHPSVMFYDDMEETESLVDDWFISDDVNFVFERLHSFSRASGGSLNVAFGGTFLIPLIQKRRVLGDDESLEKLCEKQANLLFGEDEETGKRISQLVVPLYASANHWLLCAADFESRVIAVYEPFSSPDSRGRGPYETEARRGCDSLRCFFSRQTVRQDLNRGSWLTTWGSFDPPQEDAINCGVFISILAKVFSRINGACFPDLVQIDDVTAHRKSIISEIALNLERERDRAKEKRKDNQKIKRRRAECDDEEYYGEEGEGTPRVEDFECLLQGVHWRSVPRTSLDDDKGGRRPCPTDPFFDPEDDRCIVYNRERYWNVITLIQSKSGEFVGELDPNRLILADATPKRANEITECMLRWLESSGLFLDCKGKSVVLASFLPKKSATMFAERAFLELFSANGAKSASIVFLQATHRGAKKRRNHDEGDDAHEEKGVEGVLAMVLETPGIDLAYRLGDDGSVVPSHDYPKDSSFYEDEGDLNERVIFNDALISLCASFEPSFLKGVFVAKTDEEAVKITTREIGAFEGNHPALEGQGDNEKKPLEETAEKRCFHVCLDDLGRFDTFPRRADGYRKAFPDAWFVAHDRLRGELQLVGPSTSKPPREQVCQRGRNFFSVPSRSGSLSMEAKRAIFPLSPGHEVFRTLCVAACKE